MLTSRHAAYALVAAAILLGLLLLSVGVANAQVIGLLADSISDRLDSNHDGILSREEVKAARASMFDRIDADRSGTPRLPRSRRQRRKPRSAGPSALGASPSFAPRWRRRASASPPWTRITTGRSRVRS